MSADTHRYYVIHPRNFANEYTVYAVVRGEADAFEVEARRVYPDPDSEVEEIDHARAWKLGADLPAEARREGRQHYGGWADDDGWHDPCHDARARADYRRRAGIE